MADVDPVRIRLLGGVAFGGQPPPAGLRGPRVHALLAHLVVERDTAVPRATLAFRFWPDTSEAQARTNLRHVLHRVRHEWPDAASLLRITAADVRWIGGDEACDVSRFELLVARALASQRGVDLRAAVDSYAGDLLPGCTDGTVESHRDRLRGRWLETLDVASRHAVREGRLHEAQRFAERWLRADPLSEEAYRRLASIQLATGERGKALQTLEQCRRVLSSEIGVDPSEATAQLRATAAASAPPTGHHVVDAPVLAGRLDAWRIVEDAARRAAGGRGRFVVIHGEPGIGKTRLAEELLAWCRSNGWHAVGSRAHEAEGALAFAPIVDLLRSAPLADVTARLGEPERSLIGRVLLGVTDVGDPPTPDAAMRVRLFEAITRVLCSTGRPLVVLVDDLQWCDPDTLQLLHFAVRRARSSPVLFVVTARDEPGGAWALGALVAGLADLGALSDVSLRPLDTVAAMSVASAVMQLPAGHDAVRAVVDAAVGNPFFLVELARHGPRPHLPASITAMLQSRLRTLTPGARRLVDVLAVLAVPMPEGLVASLLPGMTEAERAEAIDESWRHHLVVEHRDGFAFAHDLVRDATYAELGPARRRILHGLVAEALATSSTDGAQSAGHIATHHLRAGRTAEAIGHLAAAAEAARRRFAFERAIADGRRGLALLDAVPACTHRDELELRLLVAVGAAVYAGPGIRAGDEALYTRAQMLSVALGCPPDPSTTRILANVANNRRDFTTTHRLGRGLVARARRARDPVLRTEAHYMLGVAACWLGRHRASRRHLQAALDAYRAEQSGHHVERFGQDPGAVCTVRLAFELLHAGEVDNALRLGDRAAALADASGHRYSAAYVGAFRVWIDMERDAAVHAASLLPDLLASGEGNTWTAQMGELLGGWLAARTGRVEQGLCTLDAAVRRGRDPNHRMMEPLALLTAARAHAAWGDRDTALANVARLLPMAEHEMPFHLPGALMLEADLLAGGVDGAAVRDRLLGAARIANRQGSLLEVARARARLKVER